MILKDIHDYEVDELGELSESGTVSFDIDASVYHPYDRKGISSPPRGKYKKKNKAVPEIKSNADN